MSSGESLVDIEQAVDDVRASIYSDSYQISIGELANLYEREELTIMPEFQRELRWSSSQQVAFIESILIGFPLPSVFVASRDDGTWDLLDGLQRISTIFRFLGILRADNGSFQVPLRLSATDRLPGLEGVYFAPRETGESLTERMQRDFRQHRLDIKVILRQSDPGMLFDLFARLNLNGSQMSTQDIRNALIGRYDSAFKVWMDGLAEDRNFLSTVALSENEVAQRYHYQLLLLYLAIANDAEIDLDLFNSIDDGLRSLIKPGSELYEISREDNEGAFRDVFISIEQTLGANAFEPPSHNGRGFSQEAFIVLSAACAYALSRSVTLDLPAVSAAFWKDEMMRGKTLADHVRWARSFVDAQA